MCILHSVIEIIKIVLFYNVKPGSQKLPDIRRERERERHKNGHMFTIVIIKCQVYLFVKEMIMTCG